MRKRTRSVLCLLICLLLLLAGIPAIALAVSSNRVYANEISAKPGDTIEIPVYISGNTGFMGISLIFSYDSEIMTPISVSKGSLVTSGLFDDSIGTTENSEFKVIWCGSEEINSDGEFCNIKFKISDNATESYKIKITYDSKNTFDKDYKSVKLNCEDVNIGIQNDEKPAKLTFWQKVVNFFVKIWKWVKNIFD